MKIVEIDSCTLPVLGKPTYQVVFRRAWTGEKHVIIFGALRALGQTWKPIRIVIDATGVGENVKKWILRASPQYPFFNLSFPEGGYVLLHTVI